MKGKSDAPTKIKEVKSTKSNEQTPSSTSQYTLTNKRMSVPQQKKPKKSFEEALFEGMSPRHTMKRQPEKERKSNVNMLKSDKEQVFNFRMYYLQIGPQNKYDEFSKSIKTFLMVFQFIRKSIERTIIRMMHLKEKVLTQQTEVNENKINTVPIQYL